MRLLNNELSVLYNFLDIVEHVYKKLQYEKITTDIFILKDNILEFIIENDIKELEFEGMVNDYETLIDYYLGPALSLRNLVYNIDYKYYGSYHDFIFDDAFYKNIKPRRV